MFVVDRNKHRYLYNTMGQSLTLVQDAYAPSAMLHSVLEVGRDPLCEELLPAADDSAASATEEEDSEGERNHHRNSDTPSNVSDAPPPSPTSASPWALMGNFLGRLTRASSPSTSSSSTDPSCALVSVDRLGQSCRAGNLEYAAPIVGYEVMEERARFTVFKVLVQHQASGRQWFVFRRYTDFARLNRKLRTDFRGLRLSLPPKRWFGDNFDPMFLEERLSGLQAFVDNVIAHTDISKCPSVREFFCLDDPPGPDDSLEESKALCENLEDLVIHLQEVVRQRDREVALLKTEVSVLKAQQKALLKSLKLQSRLASVACAQIQDEQQAKMDSNQSKRFLAHMQKVNQFNLTLAKSIDRTMKPSSVSSLGSRLSLSKVDEEENSSLMATTSSAYDKSPSLEDICSRSTGDGSTGSHERLPPVGQVSQEPSIESTSAPTLHILSQLQVEADLCKETTNPRTIFLSNTDVKSEIVPSECHGNTQCSRDVRLNGVSFQKLLENNLDLSEKRLSNSALHKLTLLPLSSIPVAST